MSDLERPLRVGVVGAGWAAGEHVATLAAAPEAEVVAVQDVDADRARQLAVRCGARASGSLEEMLGDDLDAVVVATPPGAHAHSAVAALDRGVAVFLEKPISRSMLDARAIVEAARRAGRPCAVGFQWRAVDALRTLDAELADQQVAVLASRGVAVTQARSWFADPGQTGGMISERGSHHIDLQRRVAGEVVSVQAVRGGVALSGVPPVAGLQGAELDDVVCLTLAFASGALGIIVVAWARPKDPTEQHLWALGTAGRYELALDPDFTLAGTTRGRPVAAAQRKHPFRAGMYAFLDAVRLGDPSRVLCTAEDAAGSLAVTLACEQALGTQGTVEVEPVESG